MACKLLFTHAYWYINVNIRIFLHIPPASQLVCLPHLISMKGSYLYNDKLHGMHRRHKLLSIHAQWYINVKLHLYLNQRTTPKGESTLGWPLHRHHTPSEHCRLSIIVMHRHAALPHLTDHRHRHIRNNAREGARSRGQTGGRGAGSERA